MDSLVIPANDYVRDRWRNGAGWTRLIHAEPLPGVPEMASRGVDGGDWGWRLSIAEIEQAATFSTFPGVERELVLVSGPGLRLEVDGGPRLVEPPHGRCRFAGESAVVGEPVDGVAHAFNLMWRRDVVTAQLWHRPLVGPMVLFTDPGSTWAVHLLGGSARIEGRERLPHLATGDTALLRSDGSRTRHVLEGGGEVLLVLLEPVEQAVGASAAEGG